MEYEDNDLWESDNKTKYLISKIGVGGRVSSTQQLCTSIAGSYLLPMINIF